MQLTLQTMHGSPLTARFQRAVRWILIITLCVQLIAITQHHHDLMAHSDDCQACHLMALLSGGSAPPMDAALLALPFIQVVWIALQFDYVVQTPFRNFIRPLSQAPPQV